MHPKNLNNKSYNFDALVNSHRELKQYVRVNELGSRSIDFSDSQSVFHLNKAILKLHYKIKEWDLPANYLCPPIPGRADYIHHLADLFSEDTKKLQTFRGLDIGMGANCIYPLLGARIYGWNMIGVDIDLSAVNSAKEIIRSNPGLEEQIEIRHQPEKGNIFKGIIKTGESFDFSMCNPPFYISEEAAVKANLLKNTNLNMVSNVRNFSGQSNELWCNGGEALFIKRMIKDSISFKNQVTWFTTLVSKKDNLPKIYKLLEKLKVSHKTIEMAQGKKKSRFVAWKW